MPEITADNPFVIEVFNFLKSSTAKRSAILANAELLEKSYGFTHNVAVKFAEAWKESK